MLGLAVVPSLLMCFGLWFLFETPRWLMFHGRPAKAREVMEKIRSGATAKEELLNIQKDYELHLNNTIGLLISICLIGLFCIRFITGILLMYYD